MQISDFKIEEKFKKDGYDFAIGIDEAGRGPLAGPVVASAVALRNNQIPNFKDQNVNDDWNLVRDSKTLSEKQREKTYDFVIENFYVGVGICDHNTIDRINILEASFLAMKASLTDLKSQITTCKQIVLVDGNKIIPNLSMKQKAIIGGDKIVKSISAASIVAKVTRDRMMRKYDEKWPEYSFAKHKGYGTKIHMEALNKYGACEIHRRSFKPVKNVLTNLQS